MLYGPSECDSLRSCLLIGTGANVFLVHVRAHEGARSSGRHLQGDAGELSPPSGCVWLGLGSGMGSGTGRATGGGGGNRKELAILL